MTANTVEQYIAEQSCPESVPTFAQLKGAKSAFFRFDAPGFTTGELWLEGSGLATSTREEVGRL